MLYLASCPDLFYNVLICGYVIIYDIYHQMYESPWIQNKDSNDFMHKTVVSSKVWVILIQIWILKVRCISELSVDNVTLLCTSEPDSQTPFQSFPLCGS